MQAELKPCPMPGCGSSNVRLVVNHSGPGRGEEWKHVQCHRCESSPREVYLDPLEACTAWNTRAADAEIERLRARVAELEGPRPEVWEFAKAMEAKLRANDHKSGWKTDAPIDLLTRVKQEFEELQHALILCTVGESRPEDVLGEAADVANMAMMVADVTVDLQALAAREESEEQGGAS